MKTPRVGVLAGWVARSNKLLTFCCAGGVGDRGKAHHEILQGCFMQDKWLFKPGHFTDMQTPLLEVCV